MHSGGSLWTFSEVLAAPMSSAIVFLMMEVGSISETSVDFYQTAWRNNPGDSHLPTLRIFIFVSKKLPTIFYLFFVSNMCSTFPAYT
jgi:hypothetical protein